VASGSKTPGAKRDSVRWCVNGGEESAKICRCTHGARKSSQRPGRIVGVDGEEDTGLLGCGNDLPEKEREIVSQ